MARKSAQQKVVGKGSSKRIKTGIKGFDGLVQGGFLRGKSILLSGSPGTGKTIFALQFLHHGARDYGEKGLYVTLEEEPYGLRAQAKQFGWDLEKLENEGRLVFYHIPCKDIKESTASEIRMC